MPEELNLDEIIFPFFAADIEKPYPIGRITLRQFLRSHKRPNENVVDLIEKIKKATLDGNRELKDELKRGLYCFTPCVNINGVRRYENIVNFTGLLPLDFDKIDHAEEFKQFLFNAIPSIICAYTSPSRKGVKALVKIPVCNTVEEYKSYFYGLAFHLEKYEGFDPSSQNAILPLFLSYDEDLLFRPDPETWTQRGEKIDEFKVFTGEITPVENVSEDDVKFVKNIVRKMIDKIVDSGHFILRSASLVIGGYCGSGYLSFEEAEEYMFHLIDNNDYLIKNAKGYKKTARDMIKRGAMSPLYLENDEKE